MLVTSEMSAISHVEIFKQAIMNYTLFNESIIGAKTRPFCAYLLSESPSTLQCSTRAAAIGCVQ